MKQKHRTASRLTAIAAVIIGFALVPAALAERVTAGLQVLYPFNEQTGSTVFDLSGVCTPLALTIQNTNAVRWLIGGGLVVRDETIIKSASPATKIVDACRESGEITVEAWIKSVDGSQFGPAGIATLSADPEHRNFTLGQQLSQYSLRLRTTETGGSGANPEFLSQPGDVSTGWRHVVATRDSLGDAIFYINGQPTNTISLPGEMTNWNSGYYFALGNELTGDKAWLGIYYLIAVYNRALSAGEVAQNYNEGGPADAEEPDFYAQPLPRSVVEPDAARFAVVAAGAAPIFFQWRRDGSNIAGATDAIYTLSPTSLADSGVRFSVMISNALGSAVSAAATLTVTEPIPAPPSIAEQPQSVAVTEPAAALFGVTATGPEPRGYQWRRDGTAIPDADQAWYVLDVTSTADDGVLFDVVVSNAYGAVTSMVATLTVNAHIPQPPAITLQPQNVIVTEPASAVFSVTATGDAPLAYQWRRDGVEIPGATAYWYPLSPTAASDDGAGFDVIVSNVAGVVTSTVAVLTVNPYVPEPPTITGQPQDRTVTAPAPASFSVTASGDSPLTYQWRRGGVAIGGASERVYTLDPTAVLDSGAQFDVLIANAAGVVTSQVATLTVRDNVPTPPAITGQPQDRTVTEPAAASFSVTASGDTPLSYQWRREGSPIGGAVASSYTLDPTALSDSGAQFDVVVSNAAGVVTSQVATLTVNEYVPTPPTITGQPQNRTVTEPAAASFTVTADGDAPLSYQWRRDGVAIGGASAALYTLDPTALSDNGAQFDVIVSNGYGVVTSQVATLTVNEPVIAPSISGQPQNVTVTENEAASFSVTASGTAPLTYQWRRNGSPIAGAVTNSYRLDPALLTDNGAQFDVVVVNAGGSVTSAVAVLTVEAIPVAPTISEQPQDRTVIENGAALFFVTATGMPAVVYQWRRDGSPIAGAVTNNYTLDPALLTDSGAQFDVVVSNVEGVVTSQVATLTVVVKPTITQQPQDAVATEPAAASFYVAADGTAPISYQWRRDGNPIAGAVTNIYTLDPTAESDSGSQFDVVLSNVASVVTSQVATLTVVVKPTITQQPGTLTVMEGEAASFSVTANGTAPLTYQWRRNGSPIAGAVTDGYTLDPAYLSANGAQFDVVVANVAGSVTSAVAVLTVEEAPVPPSVTLQPSDRTVKEPAGATFSVRAMGDPPLSYQWRRNGTPISGATAWDYTINPTALGDNGAHFDAVVSSPVGVVTSSAALLTVIPATQPPVITLQPANRTVTEPAAAIFSVRATGDPTILYQWRRNGVNIPGATAWDYTLGSTDDATDNGVGFDVVVSNGGGTVTSRVAVLTVQRVPVPPTVTSPPSNVNVVQPAAARFAASASGDAPLSFQWRRNGQAIPGATGTVYTLDLTALTDNGATFDVVVNNAAGVATSASATLTVNDEPHAWRRPTLTWNPIPGATWYTLWINRDGVKYYSVWLNQTNVDWAATFDFRGGNYTWWVQGWSPVSGLSAWSSSRTFALPVTVPGKVALQAPEGALATTTPTFSWDADADAFWYYVQVNRNGAKYKTVWMPWQSRTYTFPAALPMGTYQWWVRTWSPDGYGSWSDSKSFSLGLSDPLSPTGTVTTTRQPEFTWTEAAGATWYYVYVSRGGVFYTAQWITGGTTWTPVSALPTGSYKWWVRTWGPSGYGPWSGAADFTIPLSPPQAIVVVAPTGTVTQTVLSYTWEADRNATWYRLQVTDSSALFHSAWYPSGIASGEVSVVLSGHVPGQTYHWQVQGWGPDGYGPWSTDTVFTVQ